MQQKILLVDDREDNLFSMETILEVDGYHLVKANSGRQALKILLDELDLGEAETIVLARELNADLVLMDEKKGRRKLTQLGLPKIGTVGILLKAKQVGLLSVIKPDLERLRRDGFSLSQRVIDAVLEQANE